MMGQRMEWLKQFLRYLFQRLIDDRLTNIAAVLTLNTLLAIIPLLAVIFNILAALPIAETVSKDIESFLFKNFVPAFGQEVELSIKGFVQKASEMQTMGFVILVFTAVLLLRTIDSGINQIWRTVKKRKALISFLFYWLVLLLGPLFLAGSVIVSSYFESVLLLTDTGQKIGIQLTIILPGLLTTLGLSTLYMVIPNKNVRFIHAFTGAFIAAIAFEASKRVFALYVTSFPMQEIIYGALSAVPLFIIWVYVAWIIVLTGAEVTHGLGYFKGK